MYNSVVLSIFTLSLLSVSRTFSSPHTETTFRSPPPLQPLVTTILLSVSMNLTILDTSFKWNHTIFIFPVTGLFHSRGVFKAHPCGSVCENLLHFKSFGHFFSPPASLFYFQDSNDTNITFL